VLATPSNTRTRWLRKLQLICVLRVVTPTFGHHHSSRTSCRVELSASLGRVRSFQHQHRQQRSVRDVCCNLPESRFATAVTLSGRYEELSDSVEKKSIYRRDRCSFCLRLWRLVCFRDNFPVQWIQTEQTFSSFRS